MQLALLAFRLGRRGREARRERDAGRDARGGQGRNDGLADWVGDAAERGFGDAAEVRGDGLAASVGDAAGRGAGPWRGGELGYRRSGREAVSSCLREIHLEPAIIDYQAVNSRKGCR